MKPGVYNFPDHTAGDTVSRRRFSVTRTVDGVTRPEPLGGVEIRCCFRRSGGSARLALDFSLGHGLTLIDGAGGVFDLDEFTAPAVAAVYVFDIEFTYPSGKCRTYVAGRLRVLPDVSRP